MKVMIIDDEPDFANLLSERIGEFACLDPKTVGIEVFTDWPKAVARLSEDLFDVVVIDMWMGSNGDEGLLVLQSISAKTALAIILTRYSDLRKCVHAMRLGAWDYVVRTLGNESFVGELETSIADGIQRKKESPCRERTNADDIWVHEHMNEIVGQYQGETVAVLYERVVDHDPSCEALMRRLVQRKPLVRPTVISVPQVRGARLA